jgi:hypothetical protein
MRKFVETAGAAGAIKIPLITQPQIIISLQNTEGETMKIIPSTGLEFHPLHIAMVCLFIVLLPSCASQATPTAEVNETNSDSTSAEVSSAANTPESNSEADSKTTVESSGQKSQSANVAVSIDLEKIGESCQQQPFVQYEKEAREHLQHGWEATQAQQFGVGFRDAEEYEKWKQTHNALFTTVSDTCVKLSSCVKQHPEDKDQKCISEAKRFEQWQTLASQFVDKIKVVESSQPPMLCSLTPSADDPSECYSQVAEQIEQTCQNELCIETASCFRAVGFLDDAINQAKLACGFVGQELSNCRGYTSATSRRKAEFQQCLDQYNSLPAEILPVI